MILSSGQIRRKDITGRLSLVYLPDCDSKTVPQKSEFAITNAKKSKLELARKASVFSHQLAITNDKRPSVLLRIGQLSSSEKNFVAPAK